MTTPAQAFAHRIADEVGRRERNFQRAVGSAWTDCYAADWAAWHDVVDIAAAPDKPAVHLVARMVRNPEGT